MYVSNYCQTDFFDPSVCYRMICILTIYMVLALSSIAVSTNSEEKILPNFGSNVNKTSNSHPQLLAMKLLPTL